MNVGILIFAAGGLCSAIQLVLGLRLSLLSFQEVPVAHQLPDHLNSRRQRQGTWVLAGQLWLVPSASWAPIKSADSDARARASQPLKSGWRLSSVIDRYGRP